MFITTQNVQALPRMPVEKVVADVNITARHNASIIGWQEIILDYYRESVRALPAPWKSVMLKDLGNIGGCPISYRSDLYELEDSGKIKLFNGRPGISKTRYLVWILLKDKRSGAVICFINLHQVAKGWSKKKVTRRAFRLKLWHKANRILNDFVEEMVIKGYLIAIVGDFNRMFCRPVGSEVAGNVVHYVTPPASIDKIILIDSDEFVWHSPMSVHQTQNKFSDHKGQVASTVIKRRK